MDVLPEIPPIVKHIEVHVDYLQITSEPFNVWNLLIVVLVSLSCSVILCVDAVRKQKE